MAENDSPEHQAQNRRIEIVLQPNLADLPPLDEVKATPCDRHAPSSAYLNLPHHLVHRLVAFHKSKQCIDCADSMDQGAAKQARADSTRPVPSGPFTRPSFVFAVVEAVQGCRLGVRAGAKTAALSLPDNCLWVTVPPQAHLISIGPTKTMG